MKKIINADIHEQFELSKVVLYYHNFLGYSRRCSCYKIYEVFSNNNLVLNNEHNLSVLTYFKLLFIPPPFRLHKDAQIQEKFELSKVI